MYRLCSSAQKGVKARSTFLTGETRPYCTHTQDWLSLGEGQAWAAGASRQACMIILFPPRQLMCHSGASSLTNHSSLLMASLRNW